MGLRASSIEAIGRAAAEELDQKGEHKLANDVRLLVNSNLRLRDIARQIHRESLATPKEQEQK